MTVNNPDPTPGLQDEVRVAFVRGVSLESAAVFLDARDAGLEWDEATRAVAAGLAQRYGIARAATTAMSGKHQHQYVKLVAASLIVYVLCRPLLGFGHELTVAALAGLLHFAVGTDIWQPAMRFLGLDPIYTGSAIRAAGGVQVGGFAVAAPIGSVLHAVLPSIFLACDRVAGGAGVSMVAAPGAPAIGRGLASFGADVVYLTIGLWVFWRWRGRDLRVAFVALLVQAQIGINHLLGARIALSDLDASGLPYAIQLALPAAGWVTSELAAWPAPVRNFVLGATLVILAYASAALILLCATGVLGLFRRVRRRPPERRWLRGVRWSPAVVGIVVACATACSPIGTMAIGNTNWEMTAWAPRLAARSGAEMSRGHGEPLRFSGATPVKIVHQADGSWQYVVDGTAETIRGVGYNPWYANLSVAQRTSLYNRDFSDMRRLGINTIEGWFDNQFDAVTLDAAARNGIGVLMPFRLDSDLDYTDPAVRARILDRLSAYVNEYKDYPAVRMWAPGNENLHRILYVRWVSQANLPAARAKADAMAAFLPVVVDRIHALDPNHPVVYRDAEDAYLPWITNGFAQAGGERPWLVYGTNVYSAQRLQEIIAAWPNQWPGHSLLISEFAPGGVGPAQRPLGFGQQWQVIRSRPDVVLGGLAYTWATNGPEDLDRVFGLVDPDGVPTDGALAALSNAYLSDAAMAETPTD